MAERRKRGKQVNFRVEDEIAEQFEEYCQARGITQTQFLEQAIREAIGQPLPTPPEENSIEEKLQQLSDRVEALERWRSQSEALAQARSAERWGQLSDRDIEYYGL